MKSLLGSLLSAEVCIFRSNITAWTCSRVCTSYALPKALTFCSELLSKSVPSCFIKIHKNNHNNDRHLACVSLFAFPFLHFFLLHFVRGFLVLNLPPCLLKCTIQTTYGTFSHKLQLDLLLVLSKQLKHVQVQTKIEKALKWN